MKKIITLFVFTLLLVGCSKEKRATNKIEGAWKCIEMITFENGEILHQNNEEDVNLVFTFDDCKLSESECEASYVITYPNGINYAYYYQVTEEGTVLELTSRVSPSYPDRTYDIVELDRNKLVLERLTPSGRMVRATYKKQ